MFIIIIVCILHLIKVQFCRYQYPKTNQFTNQREIEWNASVIYALGVDSECRVIKWW